MIHSIRDRRSSLTTVAAILLAFPVLAAESASVEISRVVSHGERVLVTVWHDGEESSQETIEVPADSTTLSVDVPVLDDAVVVVEGASFIAVAALSPDQPSTRVFDKASISLRPEVSDGRLPDHLLLELTPCRTGSDTRPFVMPLRIDSERLAVDSAVPAGCFELSLDAPGFASVDLGRRELGAGSTNDLGTVALEPGARVSIRVADGDAAPVEGVLVIARSATDFERKRSKDQRTTPRVLAQATTDEKGWVTLDDVAAGRVMFEMRAKGRRIPVRSEAYDIEIGRDLVVDPLELPEPGSCAITVSLPDNASELLEIFGVLLHKNEYSSRAWQMVTEPIGPDGVARFSELPPGAWVAAISGRVRDGMSFGVGEKEIEIHKGHETLASLELDCVIVEGRLEKGDSVYERSGILSFRSREPGIQPTAKVNEGRFVVLLKEGIPYTIRLQIPWAQPILLATVVEAPANGELVIELPDGSIEGYVLHEDGSPAADAIVAATGEVRKGMTTNPAVVVQADEDGGFLLDLVAPGKWTLHASAGDEKAEPLPIAMRDGSHLTGIELVLGGGQKIRGRLTGGVVQLPGSQLIVTFLDGISRGNTLPRVRVADDGSFEIPIAEGDRGNMANIMVTAGDRTALSTRVRLEEGLTIAVPQSTGAVLIRRKVGEWRSDKRLPVLVAADGSSISGFVAGDRDLDDPTALHIPRLATGRWRVVEPRSADDFSLVRRGRANELPAVATIDVVQGRTADVMLDQ